MSRSSYLLPLWNPFLILTIYDLFSSVFSYLGPFPLALLIFQHFLRKKSTTMVDSLADFFQQNEEFVDNPHLEGDDLFSIFESLESVAEFTVIEDDIEAFKDGEETTSLVFSETELETSPKSKRLKMTTTMSSPMAAPSEEPNPDGPQRMSHITVERNRRKQMNEHLSVLRSLMPCFYVKKVSTFEFSGDFLPYIRLRIKFLPCSNFYNLISSTYHMHYKHAFKG